MEQMKIISLHDCDLLLINKQGVEQKIVDVQEEICF